MLYNFIVIIIILIRQCAICKHLIEIGNNSTNNYYSSSQMQNALIELAEQIMQGGETVTQANLHFKFLINQAGNMSECLACLQKSDNFIFVYCSNMIKLIQSDQFPLVSQTRSESNVIELMESVNNTKIKVYSSLISELVRLVLFSGKLSYLNKIIKDLIAICLKTIFEENSFYEFLQKLINLFLPNYELVESFNCAAQMLLRWISPRYGLDYTLINNYCHLVDIMNSMFQFLKLQPNSKTYYQYRRSIYIFRNSYLSYFLFFTVQHWKIFLEHRNEQKKIIQKTVILLEHVFLYPMTLCVHQDDNQQDFLDNFSGGSNDLHFPNYFRHVLTDLPFLQSIEEYTFSILTNIEQYDQKRKELNSLIKILGRICCCSSYIFKSDTQQRTCRDFSIAFIKKLSVNYIYPESNYLNNIMDIYSTILTMFDTYFELHFHQIILSMLEFLYRVIQQIDISIEQGKISPFSRIFELLRSSLEWCRNKNNEVFANQLKLYGQKILQKAYERILGSQGDNILMKFGYNQTSQIECFNQLFQYVGSVFNSNLEANLNIMNFIDINALLTGSIIIWLHFCAQILIKSSSNLNQTRMILKFYQLAKNGDSIASLRYIKTFLEEVMSEFNEGIPVNPLWANIQQLGPTSFESFIQTTINICIANFKKENNQVLDHSLSLLKSIYIALKRYDNKNFIYFYKIIEDLLANIQQTVFAQPKYLCKRQQFFNVISIIWINCENLDYIYKIDALIKNNNQSKTFQSFLQYLHDITGLIEPLDNHQAFQVLTQLAIDELTKQFSNFLYNENQVKMFFLQSSFIKVFCRFTNAVITDINHKLFFEVHTNIPLEIHKLLFPFIKILAQSEDFDFPRKFASILQKMVVLNPISQIVNFSKISKTLQQQNDPKDFDHLIKTYFEHINRVAEISWMYEFIGSNAEYMISWWEEIMIRNLRPKINLKVIAESKFWKKDRDRDNFAKLVFQLGYYDGEYWNIDGFESQRLFVEEFRRVFPK